MFLNDSIYRFQAVIPKFHNSCFDSDDEFKGDKSDAAQLGRPILGNVNELIQGSATFEYLNVVYGECTSVLDQ